MYIQEDFFVECFSTEVSATLYGEQLEYTIALKNSKGKAMKKDKVFLKVGKKTFKAKTNSKGKATFKIKKFTKKGTYKTTVTFKGNKYYNKVVKKVKIKIK